MFDKLFIVNIVTDNFIVLLTLSFCITLQIFVNVEKLKYRAKYQ